MAWHAKGTFDATHAHGVFPADDAARAFLAAADAAAAPPSSHFTRVAPPLLETALLVPVNGVSSRFGP